MVIVIVCNPADSLVDNRPFDICPLYICILFPSISTYLTLVSNGPCNTLPPPSPLSIPAHKYLTLILPSDPMAQATMAVLQLNHETGMLKS